MHVIQSLTEFFQHVPIWITAATSIVSAASALTALTPTPRDDRVLSGVLNILNVLALNIGHSKRAGPNS